jgi:hypothetical protein
MVVYVPGRYQGRDVARDKGALVREAQLGLAAVMADRVPFLMVSTPRTGAMPTQQRWEWV